MRESAEFGALPEEDTRFVGGEFPRREPPRNSVTFPVERGNPVAVNDVTGANYQLNLNALAQEKVIELSDKGEKKQAKSTE